jgi:hypothetical protein
LRCADPLSTQTETFWASVLWEVKKINWDGSLELSCHGMGIKVTSKLSKRAKSLAEIVNASIRTDIYPPC